MPNNPTHLGTVQDVQGATISIVLAPNTVSGLVFIEGKGYRVGQVGSFIRISVGFVDLYGIVSHVGAGAVPQARVSSEPYGFRWMKVQLVGEGHRSGEFKRGISQYPTIGDEAHLVSEQDLERIYGRPDAPNFIRVGSLSTSESIPALVDIDPLITRHCAVVGATGSGKSTTVASLLVSLSDPVAYPSARIIVLDLHGEYHAALHDRANVFRISPDTAKGEQALVIPYWALSFDELLKITPFRSVADREQAAVIEKVRDLKKQALESFSRAGITPDTLTVDSPVPFSIHQMWFDFYRLLFSTHTAQGVGQCDATEALELDTENRPVQVGDALRVIPRRYRPHTQGGTNRVYLSQLAQFNLRGETTALGSLLRDTRYDFLFRPGEWCPNAEGQVVKDLDSLLELWIGGDKPISILDLSGVPVSILTDLVGVVIRLLFDALFWARHLPEGGRLRPLLLVLEEAHLYLNPGNEGAASIAARRLVKEGRKYGLGAMIISQRPSEIDQTILSQCGTIFALRLANSSDRSHVTGTVSDNLEGLFNMLPTLRTGEAIIVGEAVQLPLRASIAAPAKNRRPDSHDPKVFDSRLVGGWNHPKQTESYANVLENWRSESAKATKNTGSSV